MHLDLLLAMKSVGLFDRGTLGIMQYHYQNKRSHYHNE